MRRVPTACVSLVVLCASLPAAAFDLAPYIVGHRQQALDVFIQNFPFDDYLRTTSFTNIAKIQADRLLVWRTYGDGDSFVYHLADRFLATYPVQATLKDSERKIDIGELYVARHPRIHRNADAIYHVIGLYVLGRVAAHLEDDIRGKRMDPAAPEVLALIGRLQRNKVFVSIEESTANKIITHVKQGDWDYLKARFISFFDTWSGRSPAPATSASSSGRPQSPFVVRQLRSLYQLPNREYAVQLYRLSDGTGDIGQMIWLRRPDLKAGYLAFGNIAARYRRLAQSGGLVVAMAGGFTNREALPEGLTIESGSLVNALLMQDRHGLVLVNNNGINVMNLKQAAFQLPNGDKIGSPLASIVAYAELLRWAAAKKVTLFQTQLLAASDTLLIDPSRAKREIRERRLLALARDTKTDELHHVIFNIRRPSTLAGVAADAVSVLRSRGKRVEALLNLDVGAYDILQVFDESGHDIPDVRGPRSPLIATNLIVYTR